MVYFELSRMDNLQDYIPIQRELTRRGYNSSFVVRENVKKWNSIYTFDDIREVFAFSDNIIDSSNINLNIIDGIVFCINIDTKLISSNLINFSIMQRLDWNIDYEQVVSNVDYCIFAGEEFYKQFGLQSKKHLSFGNPMFDDVNDEGFVYTKFHLDSFKKYCLVLLPNRLNNFHPDDYQFSHQDLLNIYTYLQDLGYTIITKTRPKTVKLYGEFDDKFLGDVHVVSSSYPNETLELLQISDLCLMFRSTAISESYRMKVPTIDLKIKPYQGNDFLLDNRTYVRIDDWKNIKYERVRTIISGMEKRKSIYFNTGINKYFPKGKSCELCVDFLEENYMEKLVCNGIDVNDGHKIKMRMLGLI